MEAGLIIALLFIIGIVVGGYFLYKKVTTMYFSDSFMIGGEEFAFQDIDRYDKFKDKLNELEENDQIKGIKSYLKKNENRVYPKLKDNYVLVYTCHNNTSFSKINRKLLGGEYNSETMAAPFGMYNKDKNEVLLLGDDNFFNYDDYIKTLPEEPNKDLIINEYNKVKDQLKKIV